MDTPTADITVDAGLVAELIAEQHPDLAGPLTLVANGWDNALYRLGEELSVRVPRRSLAAELIVNEQRCLPEFAERVSVPLPVPVRVGRPSERFPWSWTVTRWFRGRPATEVAPADRRGIAATLTTFVAQLHVPAPADAPANPVRGVPLADRAEAVSERLAGDRLPNAGELRALWRDVVDVPYWSGPPLWLHADLHPANILLSADHTVAAVIDFGDVTAGDPATDLAAAWLVLDAAGRAVFRAGVGEVDEDTWARARGWALVIGGAMALHSDDAPMMAAAGRHALKQVLLRD